MWVPCRVYVGYVAVRERKNYFPYGPPPGPLLQSSADYQRESISRSKQVIMMT